VNILGLLLWNNCVLDLPKATTGKSLNIPLVFSLPDSLSMELAVIVCHIGKMPKKLQNLYKTSQTALTHAQKGTA
jgi:hypothetical protein